MEDRDELPSNSYKSREKAKEVAPVPKVGKGKHVKRRKSLKERITDLFYEPEGGDGYDYVYEDIVRPAVLDMLGDISHNIIGAIRDAIDTALFGSIKNSRRRNGYYRTSYEDYDDYWNRERRGRRRERRRRDDPEDDDRRYSRRSDDVAAKFETREEAVALIKAMQDRVHEYRMASVLIFYDMADMPTQPNDDNYGWDLGHPFEATITRVRDGYIVEPCAPIWLDR